MSLLKDESKNPSEKVEQNNTSSDINNIDLNSIEIFSEDNQNIINRIITLGGDGTVVQAVKLFVKDK